MTGTTCTLDRGGKDLGYKVDHKPKLEANELQTVNWCCGCEIRMANFNFHMLRMILKKIFALLGVEETNASIRFVGSTLLARQKLRGSHI